MSSNNQIGSNATDATNTTKTESDNPFDFPVTDSAVCLDTASGHSTNLPFALFATEPPLPIGPRRGSFSDYLPHGHSLPQRIDSLPSAPRADPAIPTSGEPLLSTFRIDEYQTDSDPDFRSSGPSRRMSTTLDTVGDPDGATIDVVTETSLGLESASSAHMQQQSSRGNKQYTLADGSIVSGKGLGRGRPGIKRGPRNPKYHIVEDISQQENSSLHAAGSMNDDRGLPIKRRRVGSSASNLNMSASSSSTSFDSRESSIEYKPTATHTRSGRQTQKPLNLPTKTVTASPAPKAASSNSPANVTPSSALKSHPKIKRRVYRGREQFALCEHCLRGHGPSGNVIVFCDACNKCWHQRCHEPQISRQTVSDSKAEWFCVDCDRILHGKKGKKQENRTPATAKVPVPLPQAPTFIYAGPRVGGRLLSPDQKFAYLNTLSKEQLIALLLDGSHLAPDLPIFETLVPMLPPNSTSGAQFTSSYVTPVSQPPQFADADGPSGNNEGMDEGYDGYYDEHAALYPKPGFGVQLPPEREDLHMLLEGKENRTFSHWVRGMRGNQFSGTGNVPRA